MGKGMKVRAVPILPATAKNEKTPQPMGNWLRGNGKHSENSRKKLKIPLKNCKTGRRRRENSHQAAQQKSPIDLKWLDISIKRTLKIGHRLRWFCAIQQRKEPVTFFMSQALGAPEGIRTPGIWRRRTTTGRYRLALKRKFCWFCTVEPETRKSPLLVVTTGFFGILRCGCTVVVKWWSTFGK